MDDSKKADPLSNRASHSPPGPDSSALDSPPENGHSPDNQSPVDPSSPSSTEMALVASNNPAHTLNVGAGINKRYRPAPAKTFQCRGYGECRMVFSRSEHLARHVRKHTGERPFSCHCGKQFSRLDNLRQHAQTVHADKADQNEQMMRDLTSLHATMAAATKSSTPRSKRSNNAASNSNSHQDSNDGLDGVKQEDMGDSFRGRPGTSTGYEGDHNGIVYQSSTWHHQSTHMDRNARSTNNHSFRDPSQSFLAPSSSAQSSSTSATSQSFLGFPNSFNFIGGDGQRPGSSTSRPPTGSADALARTLPPLSAIVSAALSPPSSSHGFPLAPQSTQHILPLPGHASFRRPGTATRPGTAPASASYFTSAAKSVYNGGSGLVHRPELSGFGRVGDLAAVAAAAYHNNHGGFDEPSSPTGHSYDSPFSFHPPSVSDAPSSQQQKQQQQQSTQFASPSSPPSINPRKRPYPGGDGDDVPRREPGGPGESYEYGTESRPASRRLSVMELCNDTDADTGSRAVLSGSVAGPGPSRPTTSTGLVTSTSILALVDRASLASSPLQQHVTTSTAGAVGAAPAPGGASSTGTRDAGKGKGGGGEETRGGGGVFAQSFREFSTTPTPRTSATSPPPAQYPYPYTPASGASTAATLFSANRGPYASPTLSDASISAASTITSSPRSPVSPFSPRSGIRHSSSPSPLAAGPGAGPGGEQVRGVSYTPSHSPTPVGMRA